MVATTATANKSREAAKDGQCVLALLEEELERSGQALMGKSEVSPGDSESA